MDNPIRDYSAIIDRPRRPLPNDARVAVWVGVNVEHYEFGSPALSLVHDRPHAPPDALNAGWRDYGSRVGIFRLVQQMSNHAIRGTAILNSEVIRRYPPVVPALMDAGWDFVAHGRNNSTLQTTMSVEEERTYLREVTDEIHAGTGRRPIGWLSPARASTLATNDLLAELGYTYALDWNDDDQVMPLRAGDRQLLAIPYSVEINDIVAYVLHGHSGPEFRQAIIDHFTTLHADGDRWPSVLGLSIHPFLSGQPSKLPYLLEALNRIRDHDGVWMTTSDEVASWYREAT